MNLDDLLDQETEWLKGTGPRSNVVMSSRARLARNFDKIPFSHWAKKRSLEEVLSMTEEAVENCPSLKKAAFLRLKDVS